MTTLNINLDPTVIAHLSNAGAADVINISITLGERGPAPVQAAPRITGPLAELMKAGELAAGDRLFFRQPRAKRMGWATVTEDGRLIVDGLTRPFTSPSRAAEAVTGNVINGWPLWRKADGKSEPTLDDLRQKVEMETEGS